MWTKISIFVTVFFGIVTFIFGLPIFIQEKISYEQISSIPLININSEKDKISVLYNDKEVDNPRLILLKISNNGFKDITTDMFVSNLKITFNSDSKVISAEIYDATDLLKDYIRTNNIQLFINENSVEVPKFDLNKKENIYLKMIVSNYKEFSVGGRIKGISAINQKIDNRIMNFIIDYFNLIIFIIWLLFVIRLFYNLHKIKKSNEKIEFLESLQDLQIALIIRFFKELEKSNRKLTDKVNKEYKLFVSSKDKVADCFADYFFQNKGDVPEEYKEKLKKMIMDELVKMSDK
jgi:hypothetical protein